MGNPDKLFDVVLLHIDNCMVDSDRIVDHYRNSVLSRLKFGIQRLANIPNLDVGHRIRALTQFTQDDLDKKLESDLEQFYEKNPEASKDKKTFLRFSSRFDLSTHRRSLIAMVNHLCQMYGMDLNDDKSSRAYKQHIINPVRRVYKDLRSSLSKHKSNKLVKALLDSGYEVALIANASSAYHQNPTILRKFVPESKTPYPVLGMPPLDESDLEEEITKTGNPEQDKLILERAIDEEYVEIYSEGLSFVLDHMKRTADYSYDGDYSRAAIIFSDLRHLQAASACTDNDGARPSTYLFIKTGMSAPGPVNGNEPDMVLRENLDPSRVLARLKQRKRQSRSQRITPYTGNNIRETENS